VEILVDLSKEGAENALRTLMTIVDNPPRVGASKEIHVRDWNGNPIDVSPARHLLLKLGFIESGLSWKGYVYDGSKPDDGTVAEAEKNIPDTFERWGKERAPVRYDAEWIISRSHKDIRNKVRELIELLARILPSECEVVYGPRYFEVLYRGVRCINPWVQQKKIWLQITHRGWARGIQIDAETDLSSPKFSSAVLDQFTRTRQQIDSLLDTGEHPPKLKRPERVSLSARFVIQEHQARSLHWDFRLEMDGALKSWAIPKEPPLDPGVKRLAVQVEDHSLEHIDYQNQIPEGQDNAGSVKIWDRGVYELLSRAENKLILKLRGERMHGEYVLLRTGYQGKMRNWLFYRSSEESP
jgi:DNA ligase D-like protein (predicted 3'-phosphoesterase)